MMNQLNCRYFNGYKPCGKSSVCDVSCKEREIIQHRILLIHLGALGAVVRSTALLKSIHQKYPNAHLTWVTQKPADQLLVNNELIDRVLTTEMNDLLKLKSLKFDVAFIVDKSLEASGIFSLTSANKVYGFLADPLTGAIVPCNESANELWQIGLSNEMKFFKNKKSEIQLICESLELGLKPIGYHLPLTEQEQIEGAKRKANWSHHGARPILGINTGCSSVIAAKKLSIEAHRKLIKKINITHPEIQIVLLGGREDSERNYKISQNLNLIQSDTDKGLRDGLISVAACDLIFTGDSLGMHMAISQRIETIAWFGPTCAHEIDFFNKGEAVISSAECSPCWKRSCQKDTMCYDLINLDDIFQRIIRRLIKCQTPVKDYHQSAIL